MLTKSEAISVTQTHSLGSRHPRLSTEHIPSTDNPPSSYVPSPTKSRSHSRPISSTTTATHSTIAPLPSDALRRRVNGRHEYASRPESADDSRESHQYHGQRRDDHAHDTQPLPPRSETPSSTKRKLGLHTLFGIALTRRPSSPHQTSSIASERKASTSTLVSESSRNVTSRRRSLRLGSRPNTPRNGESSSDWKSSINSIPIPSNPLPLSASPRRRSFGLHPPHHTPKSSTGHLPLSVSHSSQSHSRCHSVGSHQSPHDSAVALPEDQACKCDSFCAMENLHVLQANSSKSNKGKERQQFCGWESSRSKTHLTPAYSVTPSISQSLSANPSAVNRRHLSSPTPSDCVDSSGGTRPQVQHLATVESMSSEETEELPPLFAPRPVHVIPKIIHTPPTPQRPEELDSPLRPNTTPPRVDSSKVKTTHAKAVHREQLLVSTSHRHTDSITSTLSKSPSDLGPEPITGRGRFTPRIFRGKDLSKTKEAGSDKPNARGGPPNSNVPRHMRNHRIKLGSFDFERPVSALNRSSSTINRSVMFLRCFTSHSQDRSSRHRLPIEHTISSDSTRAEKLQPTHADTPANFHISPNHTGETSVVSFSSSIPSKSTEKGGGQSSSWGRASGKHMQRTSHGAFAFEHPASSPNSPLPSSSNLPNGSTGGVSQRDKVGLFDFRPKRSRGQCDPSEGDTSVMKQDRKAKGKGKGRSLDLGLGLAWAPSYVREEAVIPGLFMAKENIKANSRSHGFDVTKTFEDILSASDFETFKKCNCLYPIFALRSY